MAGRAELEQAKVLLGRPAEGGPDVRTVIEGSRRLAREMGTPTDASGIPIATGTASDRGANIFRRRLARAILQDAAARGPEEFGRAILALSGEAPAGNGDGARQAQGEALSTGGPAQGGQVTGPRLSLGMNRTDRNILRGVQLALGPVGFASKLASPFFGDVPGVIGGSPAPKLGGPEFGKIVSLGREARSLGGGGGFGGGFGHYGGPR